MPRQRTYKCTGCGTSHPRPTGKNCRWENVEEAEARPAQAPQTDGKADMLRAIKSQMDDFGRRMVAVETTARDETVHLEARAPSQEPELQDEAAADNRLEADIPSVRELRRDYQLGR